MKIYTKTGDKGETSLFAGGRVYKDAPRVEAYGTVDELNACLGMICAQLPDDDVLECLRRIQTELFDLGADLATPLAATTRKEIPRAREAQTLRLEACIDRYSEGLPELTQFILPSGSPPGAALHFARTVCRRAERRVVALSRTEEINSEIIRYLNRLSDLLFVLARVVNQRSRMPETTWQP
ncbi:MAG TPA: cob(I)yrinic acid a,c-diamide adenosyltransferase [Candidatus Tectomicrobia bacterium]|nr:cob(I)yrinic acid a,c-diamide adenosyltransferase [Candidatus Tectomicrobia bacterium]